MKFAELFERKPRPTCPTGKKTSGTSASVAAVGPSHFSHLSHLETTHESTKLDAAAAEPCPQLTDNPKRCPCAETGGQGRAMPIGAESAPLPAGQ